MIVDGRMVARVWRVGYKWAAARGRSVMYGRSRWAAVKVLVLAGFVPELSLSASGL